MIPEAPPENTYWQCQRCTACCRWPGDVKVSAAELTGIAAFLAIPGDQFIQTHTRLRTDRNGLSLKEREDGSCIFLEGNDCSIQEVKPQQCRDFPNKWNFPGWRKLCRAIERPWPRKTPSILIYLSFLSHF